MQTANLKLISEKEKKELLVEILDKLHEYFRQNNISYQLAFGTLLGAVRHQGFIPWDDDVDLFVPRADFIKLIHLAENDRETLDNLNLEIVDYGVNKKDYHKRFKIADKRTVMEEYGEERSAVFVDIFPLDCIKNSKSQKILRKREKRILWVSNLCSLCYAGKAQGSGVKKLVYQILLSLFKIVGLNKMFKFYENKLLKMTRKRDDGIMCATGCGDDFPSFIKNDFCEGTINILFEGKEFFAPKNHHEILTLFYGDYMKLPPEEERHSHEYYTMYWRS